MRAGKQNERKMKAMVYKWLTSRYLLMMVVALVWAGCKETEKMAPCESDFFYDGSPFRQGEAETLLPSYNSGAEIPGVFSAPQGLVLKDTLTGEIDLAASAPGAYAVRKTMIGNPTCGNRIMLAYLSILPPPSLLSNADQADGWGWAGNGFVDGEDKKEGQASIKTTVDGGGNLLLLQHNVPTPLNTRVSKELGELHLWFYISDPSQFDQGAEIGQFELSSSGEPDKNELTWPIVMNGMGLSAGWNELVFKFKDASVTGGDPNLSAINFFRVYLFAKGDATYPITIGLDDLKILAAE